MSVVIDGALFMLQAPLGLGAALATALAVAIGTAQWTVSAAVLFVVAAVASAWMPPSTASGAVVPGVLLLLGALLALGVQLRGAPAGIALVAGGIAAGIAGGLQTATWEEAAGGLLVLLLLVLAALQLRCRITVPARLQRGARTARRTAGAWIAAVGILLLTLWVRRGG